MQKKLKTHKLHRIKTWINYFIYFVAELDSRLAYPRPRPRLSSFKTKTKTKTCLSKIKTKTKSSMSKTETETQDLQDQCWKSMTGMNCDKQKVMASRKSSIPVVVHSKQKHHTMFNSTSISAVTVTHCSVSNFGSYTQRFKSRVDINRDFLK